MALVDRLVSPLWRLRAVRPAHQPQVVLSNRLKIVEGTIDGLVNKVRSHRPVANVPRDLKTDYYDDWREKTDDLSRLLGSPDRLLARAIGMDGFHDIIHGDLRVAYFMDWLNKNGKEDVLKTYHYQEVADSVLTSSGTSGVVSQLLSINLDAAKLTMGLGCLRFAEGDQALCMGVAVCLEFKYMPTPSLTIEVIQVPDGVLNNEVQEGYGFNFKYQVSQSLNRVTVYHAGLREIFEGEDAWSLTWMNDMKKIADPLAPDLQAAANLVGF